jgi:hypothetical protein
LVETKNILAWLELHIEQGPVLVEKSLPLAVVNGIRGMSALTLFTVLGMPSIQAPFLAIFATMRSAASPT